ncbi:MAG: hypothetical protein HUJ73_06605, partial [Eubacterium sp.]|nr:hypothetical protein [Eubacterium sp.]
TDTASEKNNAASGKNNTASEKNNAASGKETASGKKNDSASGKTDRETDKTSGNKTGSASGKSDKTSGKDNNVGKEKNTTAGKDKDSGKETDSTSGRTNAASEKDTAGGKEKNTSSEKNTDSSVPKDLSRLTVSDFDEAYSIDNGANDNYYFLISMKDRSIIGFRENAEEYMYGVYTGNFGKGAEVTYTYEEDGNSYTLTETIRSEDPASDANLILTDEIGDLKLTKMDKDKALEKWQQVSGRKESTTH